MKRTLLWIALVTALEAMAPPVVAQSMPKIWFAPMQPFIRPDGAAAGAADYFELFKSGARWTEVAARIAYFKIYPELLQSATDEQIRVVIAGLADRHIALALETPVLVEREICHRGVATDGQQRWMVALVARLRRLGGDLRALSMVGPVVDGHVTGSPKGCRRSLTEVAIEAALTVSEIRKLYPDVVVGQIEPAGFGDRYPDWSELGAWLTAWQNAYGQPLAFLHVDTEWGTPWEESMRSIAMQTRAAGVAFGVIYNGTRADLSGASFAADALMHADAVEDLLGKAPEHVIVQSWEDYPRRALPETDPTSMAGIAHAYLRPRTLLAPSAPGRLKLTLESGVPLADVPVVLESFVPGAGTLLPQSIEGTVPHSAASALFALRVHAECDVCRGSSTKLALGAFDFQSGSHSDFEWHFSSPSAKHELEGNQDEEFRIPPDAPAVLNSPSFPVSPDAPFKLRFAWRVDPQSENTGYVALIFQGADGGEIRRTFRMLRTSWQEVQAFRTLSDGTVEVPFADPAAVRRIHYEGDFSHRPTSLPLQ